MEPICIPIENGEGDTKFVIVYVANGLIRVKGLTDDLSLSCRETEKLRDALDVAQRHVQYN